MTASTGYIIIVEKNFLSSYRKRQNIFKTTVYNGSRNCKSNGGIIVRNEINLQDRMLAALRQQSQNTTFFLMNGFQMRGIIRGFDNFVVFLESDGKQQMIYKHAISTIIPQRQVELHGTREERTDS